MSSCIRKMMDLSTCHVPSQDPSWGDVIRVTSHEYGWIVFIFTMNQEDIASGIPDWLKPIWEEADKHDCMLINFDADSDRDPRFQTWDW